MFDVYEVRMGHVWVWSMWILLCVVYVVCFTMCLVKVCMLSSVYVIMYAIYDEHIVLYSNPIKHILLFQMNSMPNFNYENSKEITIRMRTILVDWLIEVHYKYKLFPATLWLTVNLLDRYLEHTKVLRNSLQLVGITSMLVACKFEEFRAPSVQDFVSLTDKAYTQQQILDMEFSLLNALNYSLLVPTSHHFMQRYLQRIHATERVRLLTYYLAERTLQEKDIFDYTPQVYAAAAVYTALRVTNFESGVVGEVWCSGLVEETGLNVSAVNPCARVLLFNATQVPVSSTRRKLEAVRKKYNTKSTQFVSEIILPSVEAVSYTH
ncbi:cyclin, partial [archaeon]